MSPGMFLPLDGAVTKDYQSAYLDASLTVEHNQHRSLMEELKAIEREQGTASEQNAAAQLDTFLSSPDYDSRK